MKKRHSRILGLTLSGLFMCAAFMNGSFINWEEATLEKVDLKLRNRHAKELLGTRYSKSSARLHEANKHLSIEIYRKVQRLLPEQYKHYSADLTQTVLKESQRHQFDPVFVMAVIQTESGWNPLAYGSVGEIGLMQLRPETAEWIAKKNKISWSGKNTLKNPVSNVKIGIAYMAYLRTKLGSSSFKYVSAYNMGPVALKRLIAQNKKPKEYKTKVIGHYEMFYQKMLETKVTTAKL